MPVTEEGIVMLVNPVWLAKAELPIAVTPCGISTCPLKPVGGTNPVTTLFAIIKPAQGVKGFHLAYKVMSLM
jgi:hypothetical protein